MNDRSDNMGGTLVINSPAIVKYHQSPHRSDSDNNIVTENGLTVELVNTIGKITIDHQVITKGTKNSIKKMKVDPNFKVIITASDSEKLYRRTRKKPSIAPNMRLINELKSATEKLEDAKLHRANIAAKLKEFKVSWEAAVASDKKVELGGQVGEYEERLKMAELRIEECKNVVDESARRLEHYYK